MEDKEKMKAFHELLSKYRAGKCTAEQERAIDEWFGDLSSEAIETSSKPSPPVNLSETIFDGLRNKAQSQGQSTLYNRRFAIWLGSIAACLTLIIGVWYLSDLPSEIDKQTVPINFQDGDVLPGKSMATLTNKDGESIQTPDPDLSKYPSEENQDLSLSTPVAATYNVELEDGTRVWLNAESQLQYPSRFGKSERRVQLTGEAYFDVETDTKRPFIIEAAETTIEVLGTTINVSAYQQEVVTTLVKGSVKIHASGINNTLRPGQQARCYADQLEVSQSNLNKNLAWQRGEFYFDGSNLIEVCEQISRWYDVDIEGIDEDAVFSSFKGSVDRNQNLSKVLNILSVATGKKFEIRGRKIVAV